MHLIYVDESGDYRWFGGCTSHFVLSALVVPEHAFNEAFRRMKEFRRQLAMSDQIRMRKEIHATSFVAGRGRLGPNVVGKGRRCEIFRELLGLLNNMHDIGVYTINCCLENGPGRDNLEVAVDRMMNRLNRTLEYHDTNGILVFDVGHEQLVKKVARRMHVFNPVPSMFGDWGDGSYTKNIPALRLLGDPFFKSSEEDYFLQAVDCVAFALLKQEEPPTSHVVKYGIQASFALLPEIWWTSASGKDPQGVVRT